MVIRKSQGVERILHGAKTQERKNSGKEGDKVASEKKYLGN